jgi:hypothetical protein
MVVDNLETKEFQIEEPVVAAVALEHLAAMLEQQTLVTADLVLHLQFQDLQLLTLVVAAVAEWALAQTTEAVVLAAEETADHKFQINLEILAVTV